MSSVFGTIPNGARVRPATIIFEAQFGIPTPARYDFTIPANAGRALMRIEPGTTYLIDRMSIGGNVTEEQYLESIDIFPSLRVDYFQGAARIYTDNIPVVNYTDNSEVSAWAKSCRGTDQINLTMTGALNQLPSMVGIASVRIQVSFVVYAIPIQGFERKFESPWVSK